MAGKRNRDLRARQRVMFMLGCGAILASGLALTRPNMPLTPEEHPVISVDWTYMGNATCTGDECHSAEQATSQSGQMIGDESNIWEEWDPHSAAYATLENEDSKTIAAKLKIADAKTSSECLSCHAMDVKEANRGDRFKLANAVGCESCHGPGEKWIEPHKEEGWTAGKRTELKASGLWKEYGLRDTTDLTTRAQLCVACHLAIDKKLIDAGHPALEFEMWAYNSYASKKPDKEYYVHWSDPEDDTYFQVKLWAVGQLAAHKAAQEQVESWKAQGSNLDDAESLAAIYEGGNQIVTQLFGNSAADMKDKMTAGNIKTAAARLAAEVGPKASNAIERRIVMYGVYILSSSSSNEDSINAVYEHYSAAEAAEGDAYVEALKKMADAVK